MKLAECNGRKASAPSINYRFNLNFISSNKSSIYVASLTASQLYWRRTRSIWKHTFLASYSCYKCTESGINLAVCSPKCPLATGSSALKHPLLLPPASLVGHSVKSPNHKKSNLFSADVLVVFLILRRLCELSEKSTHQWETKSKTAAVEKQERSFILGF